jgi:hypothetical protein
MSEIEPTPAPQPEPAVTAASAAPSTSANAAPAAPRSVNPAFILHPSSFYSLALDIFLILLIALGIFFRFNWSNWSQGTDLHPDEYGLTSTLTQLHIRDTLGDYFNTRLSSMSPYQKYDIVVNPIAPSAD